MEQNVLTRNIWNSAGRAGLALGAVSAAYLFAGQMVAGNLAPLEPATVWQQIAGIVLWGAKLVSCVGLMVFFMSKFAKENEEADQKAIHRMGMATAFLSAMMFSAIYLANMLYISSDLYDKIFQTVIEQAAPMMDSNSLSTMERMMGSLPQITFCYNMIYCFLFGTVLSAIISRTIVARKASSNNEQEEL
jgi:mannose/fructose/N-acetylgalactosamine-specific phosphotransferase system component IIC